MYPPPPDNDRICDHNAMLVFPQEKISHYTTACEYFQNNGVTWCIDVYFEDACLNPFHFCLLKNTDIE